MAVKVFGEQKEEEEKHIYLQLDGTDEDTVLLQAVDKKGEWIKDLLEVGHAGIRLFIDADQAGIATVKDSRRVVILE